MTATVLTALSAYTAPMPNIQYSDPSLTALFHPLSGQKTTRLVYCSRAVVPVQPRLAYTCRPEILPKV
ncbi:hypothetical protein RvY_16095 [Ramazzottius varieornatus]|uniref:Uncharacterized protein n=1 Tax=Ramazzottius varieornatus TaxID=947166 RepID=A0A1D1VYM1_RAMVA|nr:hypothetical protein RvY_16095 [Ramazzottius varieornatus]